ncbi:MAG: phosphatase PAP2 family protein [Candidatus Daviesbacteria bacterium]|nr:phosphatase PAP2 family protein [Candidatus Daviesbacteria bacterium]
MGNESLFFILFSLGGKNIFLDWLMIFGAEAIIFLSYILIFILAIYGRVKERKALVLALISFPILIIIIKIIHLFIYNPRPFIEYDIVPLINHYADASFPSRHTTIMSSFAFSYILTKSKWASLFIVMTIWVGLGRVFIGIHYPADIIGGVLVGFLSVIFALKIARILKFKFFLK